MEGDSDKVLQHATCVALEGRGALLLGPSGAGKSDLALRTMTTPIRVANRWLVADLVADDQVRIERRNGRLYGHSPAAIAGKLEVRGLGIIVVPSVAEAEIVLAVDLVPANWIDRLPEPVNLTLLGCQCQRIALSPFEASAHAKLLLALSDNGSYLAKS